MTHSGHSCALLAERRLPAEGNRALLTNINAETRRFRNWNLSTLQTEN
jgi:hypothetical protein